MCALVASTNIQITISVWSSTVWNL